MSRESFGSFVPGEEKRNVIEDISTNMCPKCFECDVSEDNSIIFPIEDEYWISERYCYGGFGKKTYTVQPHYCKCCDSAFWNYQEVKKIHMGTIVACVLLSAFSMISVFMVFLGECAMPEKKGLFIGLFGLSLLLEVACAFYLGTENSHKDYGIEQVIKDHYYYRSLNDSVYFRSKFNIEKLSEQERKTLEGMVCSSDNKSYMPTLQHLYLGGMEYESII